MLNRFRLWLARLFVPSDFQVVPSDAVLKPRAPRQININSIREQLEKAWQTEEATFLAELRQTGFSPEVLEKIQDAKNRARATFTLRIDEPAEIQAENL